MYCEVETFRLKWKCIPIPACVCTKLGTYTVDRETYSPQLFFVNHYQLTTTGDFFDNYEYLKLFHTTG